MFRPNDDRVVVKPIPAEEKTKGGLFKPIEAQKIDIWEVVFIGRNTSECKNCKSELQNDLKPTDIVWLNENAGMPVNDGEADYKVIRFSDIHLYEDNADWKARMNK